MVFHQTYEIVEPGALLLLDEGLKFMQSNELCNYEGQSSHISSLWQGSMAIKMRLHV